MQTLDRALRTSRAAIIPYVESIQNGYEQAGSKARALIRHPPKAARILTNRYVLISLVAGACLFAANRLRNWRNHAAARARHAASKGSSPARKTGRPARNGSRATGRAARVH